MSINQTNIAVDLLLGTKVRKRQYEVHERSLRNTDEASPFRRRPDFDLLHLKNGAQDTLPVNQSVYMIKDRYRYYDHWQ